MISLHDRIAGALLALACGDALGAPAEFKTQAQVQAQWGKLKDMVGGGSWAPGEWTDDTAMALCIAEGMLENPDAPIGPAGARFLSWSSDAKDVGSTIQAALSGYRGDWPAAARGTPQARNGKAAGNGSLMRTLPVALGYSDEAVMLMRSAQFSSMTHWDPQAEVCCAIYCLWVTALLDGSSLRQAWSLALIRGREIAAKSNSSLDTVGTQPLPDEFWSRLENVQSKTYGQLQHSGYAGYVLECLEAAVWCCLNAASLEDCLVQAVNLAGEADTIAAIAGGAAGAHWGKDNIPGRWLDALLQREAIERTAHRLFHLREHLAVYATPGLPPLNFDWIEERVAAGRNPLTVRDVDGLAALGVTHFLDLRGQSEYTAPRFGAEAVARIDGSSLRRFNLAVTDMGAPTKSDFNAAYAFIERTLSDRESRIYIHCRAGMERTAAILIAYFARRDGTSYDRTLARLRCRREILQPLPHQEIVVREWLNNNS